MAIGSRFSLDESEKNNHNQVKKKVYYLNKFLGSFALEG